MRKGISYSWHKRRRDDVNHARYEARRRVLKAEYAKHKAALRAAGIEPQVRCRHIDCLAWYDEHAGPVEDRQGKRTVACRHKGGAQ